MDMPAAARPSTATSWARATFIVLAMAALLMLPAFWNGYPLLYYDTMDYVVMPFTWRMPVYRTGGYGVFAAIGREGGTLWAVIAAQCLIVSYVLYEARRIFVPALRGLGATLLFAGILLLTAAPWVSSEVMPDVFTTPAVLLTLMLIQREVPLGHTRTWLFVALLGIAIAAHPTHLAIVGGLAVCAVAIDWLARRGWPLVRLRVRWLCAALALGIFLSGTANWLMTDKVALGPRTTSLLMLAVSFQDGLAQRYLAETCGKDDERQSILCPYRELMPRTSVDWLWHNDYFWKLGGWEPLMAESANDVSAIFKRHPVDFVLAAASLMAEQLVTLQSGEDFEHMQTFISAEIKKYYPNENDAFLTARQQQVPERTRPLRAMNYVLVPVMLGSVLALACLAFWAGRRDRTVATMAALVFLAYIGNAFICGAVSNPADRYGNRIAWGCAAVFFACLVRLRETQSTAGARGTPSAAG